ncbi:hypothetical protein EJ02DRAFT_509285 [Clathrospora elynae]|uniref:Uncharacterized protein n=1 Tax=Clathrospora elynae TaxID=706981 RepID=A0A6A5T080_9PLEO|nr:hypothetical protein EJ02DRAFT_509285 [Clathrospora elynae]
MGRGKPIFMVLRVLSLIAALGVVGLGAWTKFIVHDVDVRGTAIIEMIRPEQSKEQYWRAYFTAVLNGVVRLWISIAGAAFASLAAAIIVLATLSTRMHMSSAVLIPIECLCMCAMATTFGTSLSFVLSLNSFNEAGLGGVTSPDLMMFAMLVPLSKGYVAAAGTGWFLFLVAFIVATIDACNRAREKESCSFEPTASALGMSHGYATTIPPAMRSRVPTMYDPLKSLKVDPEKAPRVKDEEEKDSMSKSGDLGRADSVVSQEGRMSFELEKEKEIPAPLPGRVLQIRPSRPWSELPARKKMEDHVVHAI